MERRYLRSSNYFKGHRTRADSAYAGSRRLGDRRRERRSRQTWREAHDADPQDAEAWNFPPSSPEQTRRDAANGTETGLGAERLIGADRGYSRARTPAVLRRAYAMAGASVATAARSPLPQGQKPALF